MGLLAKDRANALVPLELGPIRACHKNILVPRLAKPSIALGYYYIARMSASIFTYLDQARDTKQGFSNENIPTKSFQETSNLVEQECHQRNQG